MNYKRHLSAGITAIAAIALVTATSLPAWAGTTTSLPAKGCSGGATVQIYSIGYGAGYHRAFNGPYQTKTVNVPGSNQYYLVAAHTQMTGWSGMSGGLVYRNSNVLDAFPHC
jgi:hypothetical protein